MKSTTNDLKYWFTVHTSLDVIEEKTRKTDFKDLYLGLLYLTEDFRMYNKFKINESLLFSFVFSFSLLLAMDI